MKNRQFIILCLLVVIGFCVLWFQNNKIYNYEKDLYWYILWSTEMTQDKIDISSQWILKAIYWLDDLSK